MADAPQFAGVPFALGGETYTVPPLALGAVKQLLPRLQAMRIPEGIPDAATLDLMLDVIAASMRRNYPEMTAERLADVVDLGNIGALFEVVMGGSGLAPKGAPAASDPPVAPAIPSTGA